MNCTSEWQWDLANSESVKFDADIVGRGVLASFPASALTALSTSIVGLITYSLPKELTNDVDRLLAQEFRKVLGKVFARCQGLQKLKWTEGESRRDDRIIALEAFMLSVSDQILVSGVAILIANYVRHSDITIYSVNVLVALSVLAATVHLATIPILRRHLRQHLVIRISRTISMTGMLVMMIFLLIVQISTTWQDDTHIFFVCGLQDFRVQIESFSDGINLVASLLVPLSLIFEYGIAFYWLYSADEKPSPETDLLTRLLLQHPRVEGRDQDRDPDRDYRREILKSRAQRMMKSNLDRRWQCRYPYLLAESWAFHKFHSSFSCKILWLVSANVYGITKVFTVRTYTDGMSGNPDEMGFGQIVPLALLALPLFAGVQSFYDYYDKVHKNGNGSPPGSDNSTFNSSGTANDASPVSGTNTASRSTEGRSSNPSPPQESTQSSISLVELAPDGNRIPDEDPVVGRSNSSIPKGSLNWWHGDGDPIEWITVKAFVYMHVIFMLAFAPAFGWGLAADGYQAELFALFIIFFLITVRSGGQSASTMMVVRDAPEGVTDGT